VRGGVPARFLGHFLARFLARGLARGLAAALVAALGLLAGAAQGAPLPAGTANVSYSVWTVSGSSVLVKFLLPTPVAQSLTGGDVPVLTTRKLGDYVLQHLDVQAAGRNCPAVDQGYDLGKVDPLAVGADLYGFEILFRCPSASGLVLHDHVLFARAAGHVNFARIEKDGHAAEQLFTASRQTLSVPDGVAMPAAGISSYLGLGAMHIALSIDRLCLLLGSLLLIRRKEEAGYAFAALVVGYAASLLVVTPGWIVARPTLLEAFIGYMVALLAALIILRELRQPRISALGCPALLAALALGAVFTHAPWAALMLFGGALLAGSLLTASAWLSAPIWLVPLAVLGFLDGFGLPSALAPLHLSPRSQLWMTAGFDAGAALIGAVVMGTALAVFVLVRQRITGAPRALLNEIAAACLGGLGTFWLVSRLYS
jgi:hypothetical protein